MELLLDAITRLDDDSVPTRAEDLASCGFPLEANVDVEPIDDLEQRVLGAGAAIARTLELHPIGRGAAGTVAVVPPAAAEYVALRFRLREAREVRCQGRERAADDFAAAIRRHPHPTPPPTRNAAHG